MEVIPAIDLRGGRCVRLYQGDFSRESVYSDDPEAVAREWAEMGAARLHVVDLDGARDGLPANLPTLERIAAAVSVPVQFGGGVRSAEGARSALDAGADRVILGTVAVERPSLVRELCDEHGAPRVVVGVDARDGGVVLRGWTSEGGLRAAELIDRMLGLGVSRFIYTDVSRDGTLTEPDFSGVEALARKPGVKLIAAGGIADVDHLARLARIGVEAAVVGKALYTGDIDLGEAIEAVKAAGGVCS